MEMMKKFRKTILIAAGIICITIVLLEVFLPGLLETSMGEPVFPVDHLFVDTTYLLKTDETNESVNVTCDIYLTNIWEKESGDIKAIVYVIETENNFAEYKNKVETGRIKANSTAEIEIPLVLSNNTYKVDVLLFENDKLVIKGELRISAYPQYSWEEIMHGSVGKQSWNIKNVYSEFSRVR
ncbi:MAG: hypothetical protein DRN24_03870 [Thermoplasmata archaeon]|nr:MAG: hypothetical protein DRN24_03870 [Thermoplasmata archaeon]